MMESLERLREKKIIRCIGVSNFSVRDMQEVMKAGVIDYCQVCYNILWRRGEGELIPFCNQNNIGIVTYSSLAEGILTGKFGKEVDFPKDDHRKYTVFFDKDLWPKIYESVEKLKVVASRGNLSLTHCAIQWLLAKQGVVSVLTGARNPSQIKNNLAALKLESVDKTMLEKLTEISNHLAPLIPDIGNIFKWYP